MIRRPPRSTPFPTRRSSDLKKLDRLRNAGVTQFNIYLMCGDEEQTLEVYKHKILPQDRKSTRLNSSHGYISYAVFCLKKKNISDSENTHSKQRQISQSTRTM